MFVISVFTATVIIVVAVLFMKFQGNAIIEKQLSKMAGAEVRFQGISMDLDKGSLDFKGFSIVNEIDFEKKILSAEKVTVFLNKEIYDREKRIVLDEVYIKKGVLNIERQKNGAFLLSSVGEERREARGDVAYAEEVQSSALYDFAKNFRKIYIEDASVHFKDAFISTPPFWVYCDKFNFVFISNQEPDKGSGAISVKLVTSLRIPKCPHGDGAILLEANMAVYPERTDTEVVINTEGIDLMIFQPYFSKNIPFTLNDGLFRSATSFRMHNNVIDSLTTMVFSKLNLVIDSKMENAQFMSASANSIAKYLTSSKGEIVFDFVIKGPLGQPAIGLGPNVKYAIGMVVIEEIGKALQQMQQTK